MAMVLGISPDEGSLAVTPGKAAYGDLSFRPMSIHADVGVRRWGYSEVFYYGNPGGYMESDVRQQRSRVGAGYPDPCLTAQAPVAVPPCVVGTATSPRPTPRPCSDPVTSRCATSRSGTR